MRWRENVMDVTQGSVELLIILMTVVLVFGTGVVGCLAGALRRGLSEFGRAGLKQRGAQGRRSRRGQIHIGDGSAR